MSNPYRNALAELYAASQLYTGLNPAAADVCPAELVRRLMDAMAASAALLAQPELTELTDEALTTTYAYVEELPLLVPLAQPVAVSERLPGAEDCDEQGRCWWGFEETDDYEPCWTLRKMHGIPFSSTRFIPANALPTPNTP